ncbi:E3 ubiquitin-protein ligase rnf8 isoform X2 [Salarias fasciatus]|nr:E3 ubiquitin-protein ligase RNF8 isoform X2 [Salarias fasciatus]
MENSNVGEDESSSKEFFCLMRVGRKSDWLHLPENTTTSVGRNSMVNYQLVSSSCPLMISRLHCIFSQKSGRWTVMDNKSPNGVWVNRKRVPPLEHFPLKLGDSVQIGVPVGGDRVEFDYVFTRCPQEDMKFCMARQTSETIVIQENLKRKRATEQEEPSTSEPKPSLDESVSKPCPLSVKRRRQMKQLQQQQQEEEMEEEVDNTSDLEKLQMYSQNIRMMRAQVALLEGKHRHGDSLPAEEVTVSRGLLEMIRSKMHRMELLEKSFNESKKQLKEQKTQHQEEHLKKQLEEALQEQKKVMEELAVSRQGFEEMLSAKNKELEVTKEEKEKARAQKDEVVTQVTEVLENELQCIICAELLIKAVILNCAHSFCSYCINQWRKKKDECPICREAIQSQTRCLALDNCIDGMVENLSAEMKTRRQALIKERSRASMLPLLCTIRQKSQNCGNKVPPVYSVMCLIFTQYSLCKQ